MLDVKNGVNCVNRKFTSRSRHTYHHLPCSYGRSFDLVILVLAHLVGIYVPQDYLLELKSISTSVLIIQQIFVRLVGWSLTSLFSTNTAILIS